MHKGINLICMNNNRLLAENENQHQKGQYQIFDIYDQNYSFELHKLFVLSRDHFIITQNTYRKSIENSKKFSSDRNVQQVIFLISLWAYDSVVLVRIISFNASFRFIVFESLRRKETAIDGHQIYTVQQLLCNRSFYLKLIIQASFYLHNAASSWYQNIQSSDLNTTYLFCFRQLTYYEIDVTECSNTNRFLHNFFFFFFVCNNQTNGEKIAVQTARFSK